MKDNQIIFRGGVQPICVLPSEKKVLVACEESQRVVTAFREKGFVAFSCDVLPPSGGHPEWHIQGDVLPLINGNCKFTTVDGTEHEISGNWDLMICHPPLHIPDCYR